MCRCRIRDLLADGRCSQAVPEFLSTADVGRLVPAEEAAGSGAPEWENGSAGSAGSGKRRLRRRRAETEELGASGKLPLFLHTPSFMASAEEDE